MVKTPGVTKERATASRAKLTHGRGAPGSDRPRAATTIRYDTPASRVRPAPVHAASGPTQALGRLKRALDAAGGQGLDAQLDLERDLQREAGGTPDFAEGVRAFLEKRAAGFTGRAG